MDGSINNLSETMRGASRFYIPVYQRNYDWELSNCGRLLEDLKRVYDEDLGTHFFGSLVVKPGNKHGETIVIDGQQRLTTVSIMLLALANYMDAYDLKAGLVTSELIINNYLIDQLGGAVDNFRLVSNPRDFSAYKKLYLDPKHYDKGSNITRNYNSFRNYFEEHQIEPQALLMSFQRLEVMIVNLNSPEDDPQQIFESLNSTGLALTDADRIRNYLLMNESQEQQEFYFNTYWEPLEELTLLDVEEFFRAYLTIKEAKTPVKSKIYEVFQIYFKENWYDKKLFFDELLDYAYAYNQVLSANTGNRKVDGYLYRFKRLDMTVINPFTMAVLRDYNAEVLESSDVLDVFAVVESYLIRRSIVNLPTNALNKIFATLYRDINKYEDKGEGYLDSICFILLRKSGSGEFPKDEELVDQLETMNLYERNSKIRIYILERLENYDHIETINIYEGIDENKFSIEHIMPQKLTAQWRQELGEDYQQIHENYLHNIGNLTITGYNSRYSNRSFKEKKTMDKGFDESHFSTLNRIPKEVDQWGKEEILRRRDELIELSLKIWPYPKTTINLTSLREDELTPLDAEESYTNYTINGYQFRDEEYTATRYWVDMFKNIFGTLTLENPETFTRLAEIESDYGLSKDINKSKIHKRDHELLPGVYLRVSMSNYDKMNRIREIFDLLRIEYDELMLDIEAPKR